PLAVALADDLRPGLLRDRDDGDQRLALRPGPLRGRGLPRQPAAGRPDDRVRPGQPEDGPGRQAALRPDAGAKVRDRDGRLRLVRRRVQQLRDRPGRRQDRPGRRLRAGLPAPAGGADPWHREAAGKDPGTAASDLGRQPRGGRAGRAGMTEQRPAEQSSARPAEAAPEPLNPIVARIRETLAEADARDEEINGQLVLHVDRARVVDVCTLLRDDPRLRFDHLADVTAVDWLVYNPEGGPPGQGRTPRFDVVYHLYSIPLNHRLRLKV